MARNDKSAVTYHAGGAGESRIFGYDTFIVREPGKVGRDRIVE